MRKPAEGLDELKIALLARLQGGVVLFQGVPYIHGVPAKHDPHTSEFLRNISSEYRCPHCKAYLAVESYICLNLCHLTTPQYRDFQAKIAEAEHRVAQKKAMYDKLKNYNADKLA